MPGTELGEVLLVVNRQLSHEGRLEPLLLTHHEYTGHGQQQGRRHRQRHPAPDPQPESRGWRRGLGRWNGTDATGMD